MTTKPSITPDELSTLERMCDDFTLYEVLAALALICHEKAEHVEQSYSGWGEGHGSADAEADRWRKRGLQVQATAEYLERMEALAVLRSPTHPPFTRRLKR